MSWRRLYLRKSAKLRERVRGAVRKIGRSAKLSFSVRSPMWSAFLPVCLLSLDGIYQYPSPALLAFFTGARRMYHSSRS
ncbi:unnamed protein product [Ilex paraguariensis]|uniref:Uncharacterized protein n=1 Tax=Ilex paraguariensis TaxID=185542 RepID=A0ABC8V104_9AQUA